MSVTEEIASKHLGKKSGISTNYDKSVLVAIPRQENRNSYNIDSNNLIFKGFDTWHAYEFSTMTNNGLPITRVLKLTYNCESEFIVESKSLKLYLNSFNMTTMGNTVSECFSACKKLIADDLREILQTEVSVNFLDKDCNKSEIFTDFQNIMDYVNEQTLKIKHYKEMPEILHSNKTELKSYKLCFDALRSNCRVTHQPDFGDVFIYYKSNNHIDEKSLVEYLSSFRCEYHFHEECCEMIYKRLHDLLNKNDELFVCALYTRRGGIDICPARWSNNCKIEDVYKLMDLTTFARNGIKQ